ncbi:MAG: tol-pal system protein YbgF [Kiloniellaceae bacterium]
MAAVSWAVAPPVLGQDAQIQSLIDRIDRLQRELVTLQRQVYRGEPPKAPAATGPATTEATGLTTTVAARLELRMSQLEAQVRELTGQVEEVGYRQSQLRGQLEKVAADVEQRLQRLEQGAPDVAGGAPAPGAQAAVSGAEAPAPAASQPGLLGTINEEDLQALRSERVEPSSPALEPGQPGAEQTAALGYPLEGETPEEQYKHAFGLLSQANYGEAERALRAFVEQHPDSPLAGNAKYWLGETYYVRQDYQQAAITFAEAYQQYPDNSKAPDNLLKLGMSLAALGSKPDACGTFAELRKRYPNAAVTILQRAKQERQRLACP